MAQDHDQDQDQSQERNHDQTQDQDHDQDQKYFSHSDLQDQASQPSRQINGSGGLGCNISGKMSTFVTLLRICINL